MFISDIPVALDFCRLNNKAAVKAETYSAYSDLISIEADPVTVESLY